MKAQGGQQDQLIPTDAWEHPEMRETLSRREISSVFRLLRMHGVSQRQIAAMTGQSQSEVSEILKGRQVMAYDVLTRISDGLGVPRGYMGLAYDEATAIRVVGASGGQRPEEDESVKRRGFLAHAAKVTMGAAVFGPESGTWSATPTHTTAPERIDMTDVRRVEAATRSLRALDYQYGGKFCRDAVLSQLSWGQQLLKSACTEDVRMRLKVALSDLRGLYVKQLDEALSDYDLQVNTDLQIATEDSGELTTTDPAEPMSEQAAKKRRPVSRLPRRTIDWATNILPACERERYCEEYLSELEQLAQSLKPHRAQIMYAVRLLTRLPLLRFSLRAQTSELRSAHDEHR